MAEVGRVARVMARVLKLFLIAFPRVVRGGVPSQWVLACEGFCFA